LFFLLVEADENEFFSLFVGEEIIDGGSLLFSSSSSLFRLAPSLAFFLFPFFFFLSGERCNGRSFPFFSSFPSPCRRRESLTVYIFFFSYNTPLFGLRRLFSPPFFSFPYDYGRASDILNCGSPPPSSYSMEIALFFPFFFLFFTSGRLLFFWHGEGRGQSLSFFGASKIADLPRSTFLFFHRYSVGRNRCGIPFFFP